MIDGQRVGVAIVTCNREHEFMCLLQNVLSNADVDYVVAVKNRDYEYASFQPAEITKQHQKKFSYIHVKEDIGVGHCKNEALKHLLKCDCEHLFVIEDDIAVLDDIVFQKYVSTALAFGLGHLVFGNVKTPPTWQLDKVICTINGEDGHMLDIFGQLHGGFVYFSRECLEQCGLFDERYVNAVEHIDHTYRISRYGFYTPFWAFADVHESWRLLEDLQAKCSSGSEINKSPLAHQRQVMGYKIFISTWKTHVANIPHPSQEDVQNAFGMMKFRQQQKKSIV